MRRCPAVALLLWLVPAAAARTACHCHSADKFSCAGSDSALPSGLLGCPLPRDITVSRSSLPELPERVVRGSRLAALSLPEDGICSVHRRSFHGLRGLRDVLLAGNNIRFLHRDTFANSPLLAALNLDRNLLADLSALSHVPSLRFLSLADNAVAILHNESFFSPQLTHLVLAFNEIDTIEGRAFQSLHQLKELDLSGNHLSHIHCNTFADNNNLNELNLRDNKLTHLEFICSIPNLKYLFLSGNAIPSLPNDIFLGTPGLYRLDLANNVITAIEPRAFQGLLELADLDISRNQLTFLPVDTFRSTPQLQRLNLRNNRISQMGFVHEATGLIHLNAADNDIRSLPSGAFSASESALQSVDFSGNALASVAVDALRGLHQLASLNLSDTGVLEIAPETFRHAPNLTELDLRGNRVSGLDPVRAMAQLNTLHLCDNRISGLREDTFLNVSLEHVGIDLAGNRITAVAEQNFQGLEDVHYLILSKNNISYIHPHAFTNISYFYKLDASYNRISQLDFVRNVSSLRFLSLSHNAILTLPNKAFTSSIVSHLHYIDLSNNSIAKVERRAFQYLNNVWDLNLSRNNITFLPLDVFKNTTSLWDLNISHNKVTQLTFFNNIPSLRSLNISFNKIAIIPKCTFSKSNMNRLIAIDISDNVIEKIDHWAFIGLPLLEHLKLSGNRIRTLHREAFANGTALRRLDLSRNRLAAVNGLRGVPRLQTCDLSRNFISDLENGSFSPSVRVINLSHNRIGTVDPGSLQGLRLLEQLDLSWNRVSTLGADTFRHCASLLRLDLSGNLISQVGALHIPSLTHLHLSHNAISRLANDTFSGAQLTALTLLTVANNSLSTIEPRAFTTLHLLKYLDLSRNNLSNLDPGLFQNNTVLYALDMSTNRLSHLYSIRKIPSLVTLNISRNVIANLPRKSYSSFKFSKMTHIDVSKNVISNVEDGALSGLIKLRYLDVSSNKIPALYPGVWSDVKRLRTFRGADNPLAGGAGLGLDDTAVRLDVQRRSNAELEALTLERRLARHRKKRGQARAGVRRNGG